MQNDRCGRCLGGATPAKARPLRQNRSEKSTDCAKQSEWGPTSRQFAARRAELQCPIGGHVVSFAEGRHGREIHALPIKLRGEGWVRSGHSPPLPITLMRDRGGGSEPHQRL